MDISMDIHIHGKPGHTHLQSCCFAFVPMIELFFVNRYTIVLNGKETIHEALIKHSKAFSDRADIFTNELYFNPHAKGKVLFGVITS